LGKKKELYPLTEQVNYLRQMYKYKTGTNFIDSLGNLFAYKKSSGLNKVIARKIVSHCEIDNFTVFLVEGIYQPFIVDYGLKERGIYYASIMETDYGPFLYDLVKEYHETYRRKI